MSGVIRLPSNALAGARANAVQRVRTAMLIFLMALVFCAAGLAHNPNEHWLSAAGLGLGIAGAFAVLFGLRKARSLKPEPAAVIRYLAFHPSAAVWAPHFHSTQRPPRR